MSIVTNIGFWEQGKKKEKKKLKLLKLFEEIGNMRSPQKGSAHCNWSNVSRMK